MYELFSTQQMYAADAAAMEAGIAGLKLMENAGRGITDQILKRYSKAPVLILCGPGNNGGDGYVAARLLSKAGWDVRVLVFGDPEDLTGDAASMYGLYRGDVAPLTGATDYNGEAIVIDAVFGAGFRGDLPEPVATLLGKAKKEGATIIAVDVPSGVNGTSGEVSLGAVVSDLTVTFFRAKIGHYLLPAREYVGELSVIDIGIPEDVLDDLDIRVLKNDPSLWWDQMAVPQMSGHKYARGHLAINGGGVSSTGAARIAARAGLRAGAGAVTVVSPPAALMVYSTALEAVMVTKMDDAGLFEDWLRSKRIGAVVIGPANGVTERTREYVLAALQTPAVVILDADALTVFQDDPETLFEAITDKKSGEVILTPHEAEFARLFNVTGSHLEKCRKAAKMSGAVTLLKGATTVIASPSGDAVLNVNAPPWLATAGSGDALAGLIGGLSLSGASAFLAVSCAVWVHGEAGNLFGRGLIAEDIEAKIPEIFQKLDAKCA